MQSDKFSSWVKLPFLSHIWSGLLLHEKNKWYDRHINWTASCFEWQDQISHYKRSLSTRLNKGSTKIRIDTCCETFFNDRRPPWLEWNTTDRALLQIFHSWFYLWQISNDCLIWDRECSCTATIWEIDSDPIEIRNRVNVFASRNGFTVSHRFLFSVLFFTKIKLCVTVI